MVKQEPDTSEGETSTCDSGIDGTPTLGARHGKKKPRRVIGYRLETKVTGSKARPPFKRTKEVKTEPMTINPTEVPESSHLAKRQDSLVGHGSKNPLGSIRVPTKSEEHDSNKKESKVRARPCPKSKKPQKEAELTNLLKGSKTPRQPDVNAKKFPEGNKRKVGDELTNNREASAKKIKEEKDQDWEDSLLDISEEELVAENDGEVEFLEVIQPKETGANVNTTANTTANTTMNTTANTSVNTTAGISVNASANTGANTTGINDYKCNPPKCQECGEYFRSPFRLNIHKKKHHGVTSSTPKSMTKHDKHDKHDKSIAKIGNDTTADTVTVTSSTPKETMEKGKRQKRTPRRYHDEFLERQKEGYNKLRENEVVTSAADKDTLESNNMDENMKRKETHKTREKSDDKKDDLSKAKNSVKKVDDKDWHDGTLYNCGLCKGDFKDSDSIGAHLRNTHKLKSTSKKYMESVILTSTSYYNCKVCERKLTRNRQTIRSHVRQSHEMTFLEYDAKFEFNSANSIYKPENTYETRSTSMATRATLTRAKEAKEADTTETIDMGDKEVLEDSDDAGAENSVDIERNRDTKEKEGTKNSAEATKSASKTDVVGHIAF